MNPSRPSRRLSAEIDVYLRRGRQTRCLALLFVLLIGAFCCVVYGDEQGTAGDCDPPNTVLVMTRGPDLSSADMETAVTNRLEHRLIEVQGVRQVESRTIAGMSAIRVSFRPDAQLERALAMVDALMHSAAGDLPSGAAAPLVMPIDFAPELPVGYVVVEDENLARAAETARTRIVLPMNAISGTAPLPVLGDRPRQMLIRLDPHKLLARGLTGQDVLFALKRYLPPPASSVFRAGSIALTVSHASPVDAARLSAVPLAGQSRITKLGDVAQVAETVSAPARSLRVDGAERVLVPIYARQAEGGRVRKAAQRLVESLNGATAEAKFRFMALAAEGEAESDDGLITIELRLLSGKRFEITDARRGTIEDIVRDELADDVAFIVSEVGAGEGWPAAFSHNAAESDATLRVQLAAQRTLTTAEAAARLVAAFQKRQKSGAMDEQVFVHTSATEVVECRIEGQPPDVRRHLESFLAVLGDSFPQARILERLDGPSYQVSVDWRKTADLGLAPDEIQIPIAAFTAGSSASWTDRQTGMRFQLTCDVEERSLQDLLNVPVGAPSRRPVRLGDIAQIGRTQLPVEIDHFNLQPVVRAQFIVERRRRAAAISKLTAAAEKFAQPYAPRIEVVAPGARR